jgi:hypothetical protein
MFLSLALLMPFLTSQIPEIGSKLLPMHLPVMLCGFVCGPFWGAAVGASAPILRSMIFTRPEMVPSALAMAFELATYAFVVGLLYQKFSKNIFMFYISLITAMVSGRLVWGGVMFVLIFLGMAKGEIGFSIIWARTVLQGIPGITLQLIAIPLIVNVLKKNRLMLN